MKKLVLTILITSIGIIALAQPILNKANFIPVVGDSQLYHIADTNSVLDNTTGANVIFDYSGLRTYGQTQTLYYVDPTITTYSSDFPSATYSDTTGGISINKSYNQDFTDSLDIIGLVLDINSYGTVIAKFDDNPEIIMKFPFGYGDSYSDDYGGQFTSPAVPLPTSGNGVVTVSADAWGTLKLPMDADIDSVLRVVRVENLVTDTIHLQPLLPDILPIPINATQINYYKPSISKSPLISFTVAEVNGDTTVSVLSQYDMFGVGIEEFNDDFKAEIFPNPTTKEGATLSFNLEDNEFVKVDLLNAVGQQILMIFEGNMRKGKQQINIKTSNLSKGLYYVNLNTNNHIITKKLIIK